LPRFINKAGISAPGGGDGDFGARQSAGQGGGGFTMAGPWRWIHRYASIYPIKNFNGFEYENLLVAGLLFYTAQGLNSLRF
jgi:uncharacterized membrane protein YphA (DoxX/SURF4 family)